MRDLQTIRELASRPRNAILNSFEDAMHTSFCEFSHVSVFLGNFLRRKKYSGTFPGSNCGYYLRCMYEHMATSPER